jgi:nucleoside-diphosphate-sugar epimerase
MKILLTGAFGNIGTSAIEALAGANHRVRCFDLKTRANEQAAEKFRGRIDVMWGDVRRPDDLAAAVLDQDVVAHVAFIIPRLSVTGVQSEDRPDWARSINVDGTRSLLEVMAAMPSPPRLIFTSSLHVYGRTQDKPAPRTVADLVQPIEHYARHKVECEQMIQSSGLDWVILRLAAALPIRLILDPGMFDVPLNNRIEYVHSRDVGLAITHAAGCDAALRKILLIGGGPRCQFIYRDLLARVLSATGVGMLPPAAFTTIPFSVDWLDTAESQSLLRYQQRTLDDYIFDTRQALGYRLPLIKLFRPLVRHALLQKSPCYRQSHTTGRIHARPRHS